MRLINAEKLDAVITKGKSEDFIAGMQYILEMIDKQPTVSTISIPDNATNGEILCSIFPDMHYTLSEKTPRVVTTIGVASSFDIDWWNSPYSRGEMND